MNRRLVALLGAAAIVGSCFFVSQASAQTPVDPSVVADAECAPDGSLQGVVFTVINGNIQAITIDGATATASFLPAGSVALTFDPTDLAIEETATADISFPGDSVGNLEVNVSWSAEQDEGTITGNFDVTACVPTTSEAPTTTAAPAVAAEASPSFTG